MRRRRLPLHPQPLADEALSSWLMRLGRVYGLDLDRFLAQALGVRRRPRGTLDRNPPIELVEILSERTGVLPQRIRQMTLEGYTPLLIDTLSPRYGLFATYVGSFGTFARAAPRFTAPVRGLNETMWLPWIAADLLDDERPRCCRRCLVKDTTPYVRLHWRAAWMASCPIHGERLTTPSYIDWEEPGRSYAWEPAAAASPELTFIDHLTLTAVTTGSVQLPCGRELHAGVWLRLLRSLIDEVTRPVSVLGHAAYSLVLQVWRAAGFSQRKVYGAYPPFETLLPAHRDIVLTVAGLASRFLTAGTLRPSARSHDGSTSWPLLRPPAKSEPDLESRPSPPFPPIHGPVADAVAAARADPWEAYRIRRFLIRRERSDDIDQIDSCLLALGFPIVAFPPARPPRRSMAARS